MAIITLNSSAIRSSHHISVHDLHNSLRCAAVLTDGYDLDDVQAALADPDIDIHAEDTEGFGIDVDKIKHWMGVFCAVKEED